MKLKENMPNTDDGVRQVDEIDLISLAKTFWLGRWLIVKVIVLFSVVGVFIALFSEKEYYASTTIVPQINTGTSNLGGLSSIASLAGFNLDLGSEINELSPKLYPQILSSTKVQLEIMNAEYRFEELDEPTSLYNYYQNIYKPGFFSVLRKYTIGLPRTILEAIRSKQSGDFQETESYSDSIIVITWEQEDIREIISKRIVLSINENDGYLTLESKFHQPLLTVQVAEKAFEILQREITDFKIEKAKAQMEFIQERYIETKEEYDQSQLTLASFRDANKNITSAVAQTKLERYENEFQLAFDVYSEIAKKLEEAKIKVKETTPVFSVIKDLVLPIEHSKPRRALILFIWLIVGFILGVASVYIKSIYPDIRNRWINKS